MITRRAKQKSHIDSLQKVPARRLCWHIHHTQLIEESDEPLNRICWITMIKPKKEISIRLRLMRPVKDIKALPLRIRNLLRNNQHHDYDPYAIEKELQKPENRELIEALHWTKS